MIARLRIVAHTSPHRIGAEQLRALTAPGVERWKAAREQGRITSGAAGERILPGINARQPKEALASRGMVLRRTAGTAPDVMRPSRRARLTALAAVALAIVVQSHGTYGLAGLLGILGSIALTAAFMWPFYSLCRLSEKGGTPREEALGQHGSRRQNANDAESCRVPRGEAGAPGGRRMR